MRIDSPWAMVGCLLAVFILATQAYLHTAHADADHATDGRMFLVAVTVALRRSARFGRQSGWSACAVPFL